MMGGWMRWGMRLPGMAISLALLLAVAAPVNYSSGEVIRHESKLSCCAG
jgi:hypothetical protein